MPFPAQTDRDTILKTARKMLEAGGVDGLSLNKLAKKLGISAPSLYHHFRNKNALLRAINAETNARLLAAMAPGLQTPGATTDKILAVARAYRAFAHANSYTYDLLFTNTLDDLRPNHTEAVQGVLPYQQVMAEIAGDDRSLAATRGLLALMHGFVMLELADQLRRGGDLTEAYEQAVQAYIAGWQTYKQA